MSQAEVARRCDWSRQKQHDIESQRFPNLKVEELLALAIALDVTPAELLAPRNLARLSVLNRKLTASQVLAWFAGDQDAVNYPTLTIDQWTHNVRRRRLVSDLLEGVQLIAEALRRNDETTRAAVTWATGRMHGTLSETLERFMDKADLTTVFTSYQVGPRYPDPKGK